MSRKKKRRSKSRQHRERLKPECVAVIAQLEDLRSLAMDHGLTIRCHEMPTSGPYLFTLHVVFDGPAGDVLQYWPGTGRTWSPRTSEKRMAGDAYAALDMAAEIAAASWEAQADAHLEAIARQS